MKAMLKYCLTTYWFTQNLYSTSSRSQKYHIAVFRKVLRELVATCKYSGIDVYGFIRIT